MIELIAFSQYKLGGVQNFYHNLLSQAPADVFDIHWIFEDEKDGDPALPALYGIGKEIVFPVKGKPGETTYEMARRLSRLISNKSGLVITNFPCELATLHLHRRSNKTIYYICHDEGYVPIAKRFEFIIDVFIAHNETFYQALVNELPNRREDVFFIPYGVKVPAALPAKPVNAVLRVVMAARLVKLKGVYDIPVIDELLKKQGVQVEWTIIGEGPEKGPMQSVLLPRDNFSFASPATTDGVLSIMQQHDVFILPSRLDGLPVSLLEAMSVGCVPVISAFNEGIRNVVTDDIGFVLPIDQLQSFASAIAQLDKNRAELGQRSAKAYNTVRTHYNVTVQSGKYFELFSRYKELKKRVRRKLPNYGGLLDHPAVPKPLTRFIRAIKKR